MLGLLAAWLVFRLLDGGIPNPFARRPSLPPAEPRPVTARGDLSSEGKSTIELFQRASPSVVYVTTIVRARSFFDVTEVPQGAGSGFIWDADGHVVTNLHVVAGSSNVRVTLDDQSTYPARVVGYAAEKDLAVLRVEAPREKLKPILVGTSRDLQVGQRVFAIGNPFGLDRTLTTGIVSALGRSIQSMTNRKIGDVIQTDAAINPGNSGGPLLDSAGRLVGVNTQIASPSGGSAGIGFAIPVDTVNEVVPQLIQHGKVIRPQLGVVLADARVAARLGLDGVLILSVNEGSGAEKAGLRGTRRDENGDLLLGDVILGVDGRKVSTYDDLASALEKMKPGETARLTVLRGGRSLDVDVTLSENRDR
ncbi:MAG TPA: trypsin-like peptidase domain-containing protein [Thermoanaerobaculia bacterium]|nr:trypsin-like peptidase domain-containing protein [Thermoanaerobaculia bacterium]